MNKRPNPFQPSFQPQAASHYPPLPPGPPPPVAQQQQDWSAYWAAQATAGAGSSANSQPPPPAGYPTPVPPPPGQWQQPSSTAGPSNHASGEHAALYRNYGYGGQQAAAAAQQHAQAAAAYGQWQQSQQQAHIQYPHGYPPQQPVQAFHVPYQYPQPGVPHPAMHYGPQPPPSYSYPQPHVPVPQSQPPPPPQPHAQPPQPSNPSHHNHTSPHHFPPAKRPRFDSNANIGNRPVGPSSHIPAQPPPLHFKPGGGMVPSGPSGNNSQPAPPNAPKFPLPTGPAARNAGLGAGGPLSGPGRGGVMQRGGGRGGLSQPGGRGGRVGGGMGGSSQLGAPMGMSSGGRAGPMSGGRGGGSFSSGRSTPRGPAAFRANRQDGGNQGGGPKLGGSGASRKDGFHPPTGPSNASRSGRGNRDNQRDRSRDRQPSKEIEKENAPSGGGLPSSTFNFTPNGAFGVNASGIRGGSPFPTGYTGKRTLTDFRIIGFGLGNIPSTGSAVADDETDIEEGDELDWTWGITPTVRRRSSSASTVRSLESSQRESHQDQPPPLSQEAHSSDTGAGEPTTGTSENLDENGANEVHPSAVPEDSRASAARIQANFKLSSTNSIPLTSRYDKSDSSLGRKEKSETSRIRIYFHSPVELEDTQHQKRGRVWEVIPKPELSDKTPSSSTAVGGKRKKDPEEEGDDDVERQRDHGKRIKEEPGQDISLHTSVADPQIPGMMYPTDISPSEVEVENLVDKPITASMGTTSPQGYSDAVEHSTDIATQSLEETTGDYNESEMQYLQPDDEDAALDIYTEFEATSEADANIDIEENDAPPDTETAESSPHNTEWKDPSWSVEDQAPVSQSLPSGWKPQPVGLLHTSSLGPKREVDLPPSLASDSISPSDPPSLARTLAHDTPNTLGEEATKLPRLDDNDGEKASTTTEIKTEETINTSEHPEERAVKLQAQETSNAHASSKPQLAHVTGVMPTACPSPNRISISYASSTRRLVMDADVIERVKVWRVKGKIELLLILELADDATGSQEQNAEGKPVLEGNHKGEGVDEGTGVTEQPETKPDVESSSGVTPTFHALKVDQDVVAESSELSVSNGPTIETDAVKMDEQAGGVALRRYRGILIDAFDEASQAYIAVPHSTFSQDPTLPPFARHVDPTSNSGTSKKVRLVVYLDKERPLSEPKWVKTGDIDEWLKNMFGQGKMEERTTWNGKIDIVDPDPPPTIFTIIDNWAQNSVSGPPKERRRFIKDHLTVNFDHILEILLRLVRGERAANNQSNSPYGHGSQMGQQSQVLSSPLAAALAPNASHATQQTHVSLAVLSLFRMAVEYGEAVGVQPSVVEGRVSDIIRSLPQHLVYKSLDGIFREWLTAQKKSSFASSSRG